MQITFHEGDICIEHGKDKTIFDVGILDINKVKELSNAIKYDKEYALTYEEYHNEVVIQNVPKKCQVLFIKNLNSKNIQTTVAVPLNIALGFFEAYTRQHTEVVSFEYIGTIYTVKFYIKLSTDQVVTFDIPKSQSNDVKLFASKILGGSAMISIQSRCVNDTEHLTLSWNNATKILKVSVVVHQGVLTSTQVIDLPHSKCKDVIETLASKGLDLK